jgi:hypothetical protein
MVILNSMELSNTAKLKKIKIRDILTARRYYSYIDFSKLDILCNSKDSEKLFDIFINNTKILKQLNNIEDSDCKKILYQEFEDNCKPILKLIFSQFSNKNNIEFIKNILDKKLYNPSAEFLSNINTLYGSNTNEQFLTPIMDMYLLGRIFRKFKNGKSPENIIIYSGDAHSCIYRKILDKLGFEQLNDNRSYNPNTNFQCLDISNFVQPFFNKKGLNIMRFCKYPSIKNLKELDRKYITLLKLLAEYCIKYNKGNLNIAKLIIDF